ncbi:MAG TPA: D-alanyl-D-alanine carboxypeptidase/D-alanyl-D-alanine-endopeptidase [Candidatus Binatia bacterium]|nr:D-alanyl-D-alanine carboxypeptidase/D-alanyl-D-alanine-endopeptidase [Candidatus Binatia bacterium]
MIRTAIAGLALGLLAPAVAAGQVPTTDLGVPWTAAQVAALDAEIDRRLSGPAIRGAHLGFYAIDTNRGTVLYARGAEEGFVPASTLKLVTGSTAIARLGKDFRFHTSIVANVTAPDAIDGDVVLRGGGDPLLRASDIDAAAATIAARGVRAIHGGIAIDVSAFDRVPYAPGWMIEDIPYDFSAIVSGVMLEENTVTVHVAAATSAGAPATLGITPLTSAIVLENATVTGVAGSEDTLDVQRDGSAIRITGSIPAGKEETIAAAVPDPVAYATDVFARALVTHGVTFDPPQVVPHILSAAVPNATVLWTHDSDPLVRLLQWFWPHSDNLVGEALLKTLALSARGAPGTSAGGVAVEQAFLRGTGIDPATLAIVDGSGLSRYDAITPRAYVTLMQSDWNGPNRQIFLDALPRVEERVYAKSGSMTHVWNLAGFVMTKRHGPVTFALMCDNFVGSMDALRAAEAAIFSRVVDG